MNNYDPQPINNKPKYKGKYRVDSTRFPAWNYATNGGYFITICTEGKKCFFGEVVGGEMQLSQIGEVAQKLWCEIPQNFPNCHVDVFCIMPNHVHGILLIKQIQDLEEEDAIDYPEEDAMNRVSTRRRGGVTGVFNPMLSKNSISKIVRWYKGRCKFEINQIYQGFGWQERFYDEIIRNEFALDKIQQYIINNPINWEGDRQQ
ncbi:MAG: hypothetical protein EA343_15035 [Nodularia sp. (in: Bacteria)]|nr:MAG: hypothetical protein EA343_15035 [Nodularia sp. (in: cyanobacteria)]